MTFEDGERRRAGAQQVGRLRLRIAMLGFLAVYGVIGGKLIYVGATGGDTTGSIGAPRQTTARPDLLDRNGEVLATDIKTASLFAEPRRILDVDEAVDALASVLPEMREPSIRHRLKGNAGFIWLKREITAEQRMKIHRLGIPGIGFVEENKRFYPGGGMVSHVVGAVNVDNQGISGLEKFIDSDMALGDLQKLGLATSKTLEPRRLSIDLRIQHVVRDEILEAKNRFKAIAAMGIVLDVHTGEVLAMSSVPDYDPNNPAEALEKDKMNRATAGVFEMGSVFKVFNSAMALDSGRVRFNDIFDISPLVFGGRKIGEFHSKGRPLNVTEIFMYSSNNGSARMALRVGPEGQRNFFDKMHLLRKLETELPEVAQPLYPKRLSEVSTVTMSFGHGISVTPMHTAAAGMATINGGLYISPTFFPRTQEEAMKVAKRVIAPQTSDLMRQLFRANVINPGGSGKRADVPGYRVGGKTGTAEKIENGHYAGNKRFNSFLSGFPMDDPKYLVLVVLDEPKSEAEVGAATAGLNAAPTVGNIVRRIAPMLGVMPKFETAPTVASN